MSRRRAFTIIELLSVIAVVCLMTALLAGASYRFVASARESATRTTILKVSGIIDDRVRAFREFDFAEAGERNTIAWNTSRKGSLFSGSFNNMYSWVDSTKTFNAPTPADPTTPPPNGYISFVMSEILTRKARFKQAFPQSFAEMNSAQKTRFFGTATIPPGDSYNPKFESGIVLYAVVTKGETFGSVSPGEDEFASVEIRNDGSTGNLPCLVDAWGEPLRFYRWPTRLIRCGEQDFGGTGGFVDYNNNTIQDPPGWVDPGTGNSSFSPAIRPNVFSSAPTPASLLISGLPVYNNKGASPVFTTGIDGQPGFGGYTSGAPPYNTPPWNYLGMPDTDDPEPLNIDPDDASLQLSRWLFDDTIPLADQKLRRTNFVTDFHDFYTYHTPLIVSAGPDKQLGLFDPTDNSSTRGDLAAPLFPASASGSALVAALFDNLTNRNHQAGGR